MKKKNIRRFGNWGKPVLIGAIAVVLVGASFSVAYGEVPGASTLAAVVAAISGKPTLIVSRDASSPKGTITVPASGQIELAAFDLTAKNVSHWVTLQQISGQVVLTGALPSWLYVTNPTITYYYCVPVGVIYGYGWNGTGGCSQVNLSMYPAAGPAANSFNKITGIQYFYFSGVVPVYPQASVSRLTIYGVPTYTYTGSATQKGASDSKLQVQLTNVWATGDQCSSKAASSTGCASTAATVNIVNNGNVLTVTRPYGYGYKGVSNPIPAITAIRPATASVGSTITVTGTGFSSATHIFMMFGSFHEPIFSPATVTGSTKLTFVVPNFQISPGTINDYTVFLTNDGSSLSNSVSLKIK